MNKRDFIRIMSLGALGLTVAEPFLSGCTSLRGAPRAPYWIWMSGRDLSGREWTRRFRELARLGIRGILLQAPDTEYPQIAPLAKSEGIELHAWIIVLNHRSSETKQQHPEWFTVSREGVSTAEKQPYVGYYSWLCPSKREVQDFVAGRVERLASTENLDGVHLDYIRHSDVILPVGLWSTYGLVQDKEYPEFDYCYCDVCRDIFREEEGFDPLELEDPSANQAWLQFRYDSVTRLVNGLATITAKHGKKLTAAVFPTPEIARKLVRQEWTEWKLDALYPMIYHNFYEEQISWIEQATREGVEALEGKIPVYSGLFVPALTPDTIAEAVEYALAGGATGVTFFNERAMARKFWKNVL